MGAEGMSGGSGKWNLISGSSSNCSTSASLSIALILLCTNEALLASVMKGKEREGREEKGQISKDGSQ